MYAVHAAAAVTAAMAASLEDSCTIARPRDARLATRRRPRSAPRVRCSALVLIGGALRLVCDTTSHGLFRLLVLTGARWIEPVRTLLRAPSRPLAADQHCVYFLFPSHIF